MERDTLKQMIIDAWMDGAYTMAGEEAFYGEKCASSYADFAVAMKPRSLLCYTAQEIAGTVWEALDSHEDTRPTLELLVEILTPFCESAESQPAEHERTPASLVAPLSAPDARFGRGRA